MSLDTNNQPVENQEYLSSQNQDNTRAVTSQEQINETIEHLRNWFMNHM